jgi:hypothetical protein
MAVASMGHMSSVMSSNLGNLNPYVPTNTLVSDILRPPVCGIDPSATSTAETCGHPNRRLPGAATGVFDRASSALEGILLGFRSFMAKLAPVIAELTAASLASGGMAALLRLVIALAGHSFRNTSAIVLDLGPWPAKRVTGSSRAVGSVGCPSGGPRWVGVGAVAAGAFCISVADATHALTGQAPSLDPA